jgi:hypothetical protein
VRTSATIIGSWIINGIVNRMMDGIPIRGIINRRCAHINMSTIIRWYIIYR